jgi:FtsH-binding integral membrane protein
MIPSISPSPVRLSAADIALEQATFMQKVYGYMSAGLVFTALAAWLVAHSPTALNIVFGNRLVFFGLIISELLMVIAFSRMARTMTSSGAASLFFLYSIVNGITLSVIFLVYTQASIVTTFLVTAGTFGGMSLYGHLTKRDLSSWGNLLFMGLWGLILGGIVNIFLRSPGLYFITTSFGVLIFVGLTAYDTQKIKQLNVLGNAGTDEDTKEAIHGALVLYLDFINLFLYLLRLFGRRR